MIPGADAIVFLGPVVVADGGLEALPDADLHVVAQAAHALHDGHGRDRRVAEGARRHVEQRGRHAQHHLADEGREAAVEDLADHRAVGPAQPRARQGCDADVVHQVAQQEEAHPLADHGRGGAARDAHADHVDQEGGEQRVEDCAAHDGEHGIKGLAFHAELEIEHERGAHERRAHQDDAHKDPRVGEDRGSGARQQAERRDEDVAQHRDQDASDERAGEAHVGVDAGQLAVLAAERARDGIAGALPQAEAHGLDQRHGHKRDAHRALGRRAQLADEVRVADVVDGGDEVGEDGGAGQREDEPLHRRLGHLPVFVVCGLVGGLHGGLTALISAHAPHDKTGVPLRSSSPSRATRFLQLQCGPAAAPPIFASRPVPSAAWHTAGTGGPALRPACLRSNPLFRLYMEYRRNGGSRTANWSFVSGSPVPSVDGIQPERGVRHRELGVCVRVPRIVCIARRQAEDGGQAFRHEAATWRR